MTRQQASPFLQFPVGRAHDLLMSSPRKQHRRMGPRRRSRARTALAPMWLALGGTLALAVVVAAVVTWLGVRAMHVREFKPEQQLSAAAPYDLLKVAFAVAAGIGGMVALVIAYRRQRTGEFAQELAARTEDPASRAEQEDHDLAARGEGREETRLFNERFATAAGQLGSEIPAVRLAGVYAMAGLADDWTERHQTCVDVMCGYLRMPYEPKPAETAPEAKRQAFRAAREVRHTVIRLLTGKRWPRGSGQPWRASPHCGGSGRPPGQTARHDKPPVAVTPQAGGSWLRAGNARSPSAGTTPGSSPRVTAR